MVRVHLWTLAYQVPEVLVEVSLSFSCYFLKKMNLKWNGLALMKELKAEYGCTMKCIQCDDDCENLSSDTACKEENLGIHFENSMPSNKITELKEILPLYSIGCMSC